MNDAVLDMTITLDNGTGSVSYTHLYHSRNYIPNVAWRKYNWTSVSYTHLKFEAPKTKAVVEMFNNLKINKTLVVIDENDKNVVNSVRNIKDAKCATVRCV